VSQSVRAVERALDILLCFACEEPPRSLTQIAESVHMSKATVHRLLTALEKKRFVTRDRVPGRYRLNLSFIEMASLSKDAGSSDIPAGRVHELPARRQFKASYAGF
jgi:IclR family transcriptional regulator, KDG regulon repressor